MIRKKKEKNNISEKHIFLWKIIYINDIKYDQRISSMDVFDSICQAFNPKPEPCLIYVIRPSKIQKEGIPWYDIVFVILGILLLNVIFYYLIKCGAIRYVNYGINLNNNILSGQVNKVISSYFSLKEMTNKSSDDDDEETGDKVNNLGDIQNFIDEDDKNGEKEIGTKLIISNDISDNKKENNNTIDNKKEDDNEKEEEK